MWKTREGGARQIHTIFLCTLGISIVLLRMKQKNEDVFSFTEEGRLWVCIADRFCKNTLITTYIKLASIISELLTVRNQYKLYDP